MRPPSVAATRPFEMGFASLVAVTVQEPGIPVPLGARTSFLAVPESLGIDRRQPSGRRARSRHFPRLGSGGGLLVAARFGDVALELKRAPVEGVALEHALPRRGGDRLPP